MSDLKEKNKVTKEMKDGAENLLFYIKNATFLKSYFLFNFWVTNYDIRQC